ncbi:cell division protein FtsQ/DivIB [Thiohalobacter sp. IOR34]|uniref:cell division protein FtsQ/DivIB n=1 Tax=Thiohalobacter sp. IOR34 TaxID=3057176 RepID=UPI0025B20FC9|nr:cell division protein FtsQ/DivIB [Thiohalobacter sp. IOR34]WJW75003.1 cell division protein FtsQ/DivIB [Thiohalobacter sp. IOR34]
MAGAKKTRGGQASRRRTQDDRRQRRARLLQLGLLGLLFAALAGGAGWGALWLRDPHSLPLRTVRIEGEFRHLDQARLRAAVAPVASGGFFSVDVEAVRRAAEALPWVQRVKVQRLWPDTLRLQVVEQQAVARWGEDGLLNPHGELFRPPAEDIDPRLPRLDGPEVLRERVMRQYVAAVEALRPLGLRVARLELDARRAWRLRLGDGVELKLGREHAGQRLQRFVRIYPLVFAAAGRTAETVDMRYSNGLAVRWQRQRETAGQHEG